MPKNRDLAEYLDVKECEVGAVNIASYPSEGFEWKPDPSKIDLGPRPPVEYRIMKEDGRYRIWVDSLGITQRGFQEDWKNGWSGFATRTWIEFPVKEREDFMKMKKRYDPKDEGRYPKDWDIFAKKYRDRDYPLCATIRGPFWWARDMVGLKGLALGLRRESWR